MMRRYINIMVPYFSTKKTNKCCGVSLEALAEALLLMRRHNIYFSGEIKKYQFFFFFFFCLSLYFLFSPFVCLLVFRVRN